MDCFVAIASRNDGVGLSEAGLGSVLRVGLLFRQLRNPPTISSLAQRPINGLAVETQEKHNARSPRRPTRLCARL